jgi:hypothetical protein
MMTDLLQIARATMLSDALKLGISIEQEVLEKRVKESETINTETAPELHKISRSLVDESKQRVHILNEAVKETDRFIKTQSLRACIEILDGKRTINEVLNG